MKFESLPVDVVIEHLSTELLDIGLEPAFIPNTKADPGIEWLLGIQMNRVEVDSAGLVGPGERRVDHSGDQVVADLGFDVHAGRRVGIFIETIGGPAEHMVRHRWSRQASQKSHQYQQQPTAD